MMQDCDAMKAFQVSRVTYAKSLHQGGISRVGNILHSRAERKSEKEVEEEATCFGFSLHLSDSFQGRPPHSKSKHEALSMLSSTMNC